MMYTQYIFIHLSDLKSSAENGPNVLLFLLIYSNKISANVAMCMLNVDELLSGFRELFRRRKKYVHFAFGIFA